MTEEDIGFSDDERDRLTEISKKLNCYLTVERSGVKMEFWGPYYNQYGPWEGLGPDDPERERISKEFRSGAWEDKE